MWKIVKYVKKPIFVEITTKVYRIITVKPPAIFLYITQKTPTGRCTEGVFIVSFIFQFYLFKPKRFRPRFG